MVHESAGQTIFDSAHKPSGLIHIADDDDDEKLLFNSSIKRAIENRNLIRIATPNV